jgi:cytochrome c553
MHDSHRKHRETDGGGGLTAHVFRALGNYKIWLFAACGIFVIPHFSFADNAAQPPIPDMPLGEAIGQVLAMPGDVEYGAYLATECVTCHQQHSVNHAIPAINGLPREYFVEAMLEYKYRLRDNSVMQAIIGSLGMEELSALATYFSTKD